MKKYFYLFAMIIFLLTGCSEQNDPFPTQEDIEEEPSPVEKETIKPPTPHQFKADPSTFHFIADWLNDSQVVYVDKRDGFYSVNYFDIETGESASVYEDKSFIIDVLIHPSRDYLLVHTSDQPNSAVIKVVGKNGTVQHEVEIDSTELAIEWNRSNPEKILFTAFHEDWSFDLFVFNGDDDSLSIIDLDDPFPKWAGEDRIIGMSIDHPLDGGVIQIINLETSENEMTDIENVIYFDAFEDRFVIVQSIDANSFTYSVREHDGSVIFHWTMPAVSNYSEWIVPSIEWLDQDRLIVKGADKSGQLDEMGSGYNVYLIEDGTIQLILKGLDAGPIKCTPSGRYCLNGYTLEELIDVETKKKYKWIEFDN
ncbi:hypothetical protein MHZ92_13405 [Sporosarcina sp. ACRSL]|uniref:YqgU-like beta propeller domain-containing protein n=1 Tax=Sporosarcina sp. ACRSL TaxID=2918215 RepID=UPI001EF47164|nr:hypothetical protein [Sporosarcina sp. ACRSL]MCG7345137.1 hypothetical protein [Sporosarcina sp. ACRSL]